MIELANVDYYYENSADKALNNINLRIVKGQSVSLLGPNGSGKSTLLKLINGLIFPDRGSYRFGGTEINRIKMKDERFSKGFHQRIGFSFQNSEVQLFCSNVYDEIAFGPRQMGLDEKAVEARVNDCLALLNLNGFRERQPYHLSGGEKRKVAIACMLATNPEVLVFDEPMNDLDPRTERWLTEFISDLHKSGKTVITSTHKLEIVQDISDRAVLFDENHTIAADLPVSRLLDDIELLKRVNLVDEYYHRHSDGGHGHFHDHKF